MRRVFVGLVCLVLVAGCTDQGQKSAEPAPENKAEGWKADAKTNMKVDPKGRERPTGDDDMTRKD
jgi:hypothetical protein